MLFLKNHTSSNENTGISLAKTEAEGTEVFSEYDLFSLFKKNKSLKQRAEYFVSLHQGLTTASNRR